MSEPRVHLVGAGPGDPGLMTRRSLDLIARAEVILYDRLIPDGALDGANPSAELLYVGKTPGGESASQEEINRRLVEHGAAGKRVVRLKGGDPFVFGRGGEEAEALVAAGVAFEIVPGVTAGLAAPAYAGIPPTHRELSSAVALITGHEDPDKPETAIDWDALARFPGTLVFYMGVRRLPALSASLIDAGRDGSTPAAVIERGTLPGQRTVTGPLEEIAARAQDAGIKPPAITLVGEVAGLAERLAWLGGRPLDGRTVVVTRAREQASTLADRLSELGAVVIQAPAIRIEPCPVEGDLASALDRIADYSLVCVTSPKGAELLMSGLARRGLDARSLADAQIAAIGPATAAALAERGLRADVVPTRSVAEGLVEALTELDIAGGRVLVARAAEARDVLPDALRALGAEVDDVAFYETVAEDLPTATLGAIERADYVTFTSSSTVRFLSAALKIAGASVPTSARVVSIGPVTSAAVLEADLELAIEAERHDIGGLVDALLDDARKQTAP